MARLSSRLNRRSFRLSAALGVLIAGVALGAIAQSSGGAGHPPGVSLVGVGLAAGTNQSQFTISGGVSGLYPGSSLPLKLTITNPQQFTIDVTSVTTTVGAVSAGCAATLLSVTPFAGNLLVPAQGKATLVVQASLDHSAPDGCQGATFPLTYSAVAVKP